MMRNLVTLCLMCLLALACKSPEARKPVQRTTGSFIKESAERNIKLIEKEEALIASIMEKDSVNDYVASENGFWYFYNTKDSTKLNTPQVGDEVVFTYDIKHLNGSVVISSEENGEQNYKVDQSNQELISGLRDGIKLMREGETVTFLFPSHKAYGYYGLDNRIGVNVPIRSTVTLKSINATENN